MQSALQHGIESLSQAEVGSALQVYFNLGLLTQVIGLLNVSLPCTYTKFAAPNLHNNICCLAHLQLVLSCLA